VGERRWRQYLLFDLQHVAHYGDRSDRSRSNHQPDHRLRGHRGRQRFPTKVIGAIGFEQPVRELYGLSQFPVRYISGEVRVRFVTITKEK